MRSRDVGVGFSVMAKAMAQQGAGLRVLADTLAGLEEGQTVSTTSAAAAPLRKAVRLATGIGSTIDTVA